MIVGVPREVKTSEFRVALTPVGVRELVDHGHEVLIESDAGEGSTIHNEEYEAQGARIVPHATDVYADADMILKVKEPQPEEFGLFGPGQLLFTYLHLAAYPAVADALISSGVTAIAYETVQLADRSLPLLAPMSEIAGRMATQVGARFLEKAQGGRGVLLGGIPGVRPAKVVIIGGGTSGSNAAAVAVGMQAHVTVVDRDLARLRALDAHYEGRLSTMASNRLTLEELVLDADLVIGSVLIPGASAPKLVTTDMVRGMPRGSVLVDIAIDQGGCFETSRETTHTDPVYTVHDVVHYAVGNIPGAVPNTSTYGLTNATLPYVVALADLGARAAADRHPELLGGVSVVSGALTNIAVTASLGRDFVDPTVALAG
ncbi:MAG TPA: alanine dehydrogenase [Acidimicrobiia bacterium]|nr:alanine dehydrogenase [Acidimicrobiia bacterium]